MRSPSLHIRTLAAVRKERLKSLKRNHAISAVLAAGIVGGAFVADVPAGFICLMIAVLMFALQRIGVVVVESLDLIAQKDERPVPDHKRETDTDD